MTWPSTSRASVGPRHQGVAADDLEQRRHPEILEVAPGESDRPQRVGRSRVVGADRTESVDRGGGAVGERPHPLRVVADVHVGSSAGQADPGRGDGVEFVGVLLESEGVRAKIVGGRMQLMLVRSERGSAQHRTWPAPCVVVGVTLEAHHRPATRSRSRGRGDAVPAGGMVRVHRPRSGRPDERQGNVRDRPGRRSGQPPPRLRRGRA